jgi:hypothetical protein
MAPIPQKTLLNRRRIRRRNLLAFASIYAATGASIYYDANFDKLPQHSSKLKGGEWMQELSGAM